MRVFSVGVIGFLTLALLGLVIFRQDLDLTGPRLGALAVLSAVALALVERFRDRLL